MQISDDFFLTVGKESFNNIYKICQSLVKKKLN